MSEVLKQHLEREDLLWTGLSLPVLDVEQLAHEQRAEGDRIHFHRGVWWIQAKPLFSAPCFPYAQVDHHQSWPHPLRALAGFMHLAKRDAPFNGFYPSIVRENLSGYSVRNLSRKRRNAVRSGLAQLTVRVVERLKDLVCDGHEVYVSFYQRVRWGRDRSDRASFSAWITKVFEHPKRIALGVYRREKLVGFMLPYVVDNVAIHSYCATHSEFLTSRPNDALYHAFLCIARQTPGVQVACFGPVSNKPSLDRFKLEYATVKNLPSYTWVNPLLGPIANKWITRRYPWLRARLASSVAEDS